MKTCTVCGKGKLTRETRRVAYSYKGQSVEVAQPGEWCDTCGEAILSPEDMVATRPARHDALARAEGLLTSQEVHDIRAKLGLTQAEAAELFGGGINAFSRYERGETMQPRALDRYPALLKEVKENVQAA